MSNAARLRAQKAFSTDPGYLERLALEEDAYAAGGAARGVGTTFEHWQATRRFHPALGTPRNMKCAEACYSYAPAGMIEWRHDGFLVNVGNTEWRFATLVEAEAYLWRAGVAPGAGAVR